MTFIVIVFYEEKIIPGTALSEAGATFNNSFFDNSFVFLRQFKNRSFLGSVFVHVTGRSQN